MSTAAHFMPDIQMLVNVAVTSLMLTYYDLKQESTGQ